jgi:AcrR family transcriptional regulator
MVSPLHHLDDPVEFARERDAFVEAALSLLTGSETVNLQVTEVIRRAGRHNVVFYRVFGSKEGLTLAVVEEAVRRTAAVLERHLEGVSSPEAAVRTWARTLLERSASGLAAEGTQALALDRFRLMRRFPGAQDTTTRPLSLPLERVLRQAGNPQATLLSEAALELIMSRQAGWIALQHRPTPAEITTYADLTVRLVGLDGPAAPDVETVSIR